MENFGASLMLQPNINSKTLRVLYMEEYDLPGIHNDEKMQSFRLRPVLAVTLNPGPIFEVFRFVNKIFAAIVSAKAEDQMCRFTPVTMTFSNNRSAIAAMWFDFV